MSAAHSKVAASAAKRWLTCPGSVGLVARLESAGALPIDAQSDEAADGTLVHRIVELVVGEDQDFDTAAAVAAEEQSRPLPPWARRVVEAAAEVLRPLAEASAAFWTERKVVFSPEHDGFGTCDFTAYTPGRLVVADLKTGVGLKVTAEGNPQLLCYAVGALASLPPDMVAGVSTVELVVIQPRVPSGVTRHEMPRAELDAWRDTVLLPGLAATARPDAPLVFGEHCRFCPALTVCPQARAAAERAARLPPDQLDNAAWVLANAAVIRKYLARVEKLALQSALAGSPPAGYKVVHGKSNRQWREGAETVLSALYGEEAYVKALRTPAQIEELPGGAALAKVYAYQPPGAPTLVPEDDGRQAYQRGNFNSIFNVWSDQ